MSSDPKELEAPSEQLDRILTSDGKNNYGGRELAKEVADVGRAQRQKKRSQQKMTADQRHTGHQETGEFTSSIVRSGAQAHE